MLTDKLCNISKIFNVKFRFKFIRGIEKKHSAHHSSYKHESIMQIHRTCERALDFRRRRVQATRRSLALMCIR